MINRAALLLKYNDPAVEWINQTSSADVSSITKEQANHDCTVYLLREDVANTTETLLAWIEANVEVLFEAELEGWITDPTQWPEVRSFDVFKHWFTFECHTVLEDTVGTPIYDEDAGYH